MEYTTLSNGVKMPLLGYGVFLVSPQECERCVLDAISTGYRLIDTAQAYYNEGGVGEAISKCGVKRDELFITTKVWISNAGDAKAAASIDESLRKLKTDYIDLLLIHQAYGDVYGSWRAMEKAYKDGKVRAIGVSNFQKGRFVDFALHTDIKPMVNQLQCNPAVQQHEDDGLGTAGRPRRRRRSGQQDARKHCPQARQDGGAGGLALARRARDSGHTQEYAQGTHG